jgi:hypothetical protein
MSEELVVLLYSFRISTELTCPFHHTVSLTDGVERPDSMPGPHGCFFLFELKYGISLPFSRAKALEQYVQE